MNRQMEHQPICVAAWGNILYLIPPIISCKHSVIGLTWNHRCSRGKHKQPPMSFWGQVLLAHCAQHLCLHTKQITWSGLNIHINLVDYNTYSLETHFVTTGSRQTTWLWQSILGNSKRFISKLLKKQKQDSLESKDQNNVRQATELSAQELSSLLWVQFI